MISNRIRRYERNINPLINEVPQTTKDVATKNEMNRRLREAAPSNTSGVVMIKDSPANQIIFCGQSILKKSTNKNWDLQRNLLQPHRVRKAPLHRWVRWREVLISPFDRVTIDRIKNPSPPVKNSVLQNNVRQQSCTFHNGLLFPSQKAPPPHPGTTTNRPPYLFHLPHRHPLILSQIK